MLFICNFIHREPIDKIRGYKEITGVRAIAPRFCSRTLWKADPATTRNVCQQDSKRCEGKRRIKYRWEHHENLRGELKRWLALRQLCSYEPLHPGMISVLQTRQRASCCRTLPCQSQISNTNGGRRERLCCWIYPCQSRMEAKAESMLRLDPALPKQEIQIQMRRECG